MKSNEEKIIEQLTEIYTRKSIIVQDRLPQEEWESLGEPHCWIKVDEVRKFSCYIDCAYGRIALFKNNKLLDTGKFSARHEDAVALDKDYYGLKHYIYIR